MELLKRLDEEIVHRKPDRAPPVRVAPEVAARGLGRLIVHAVLDTVQLEHVWAVLVDARDRADAVRRQELRLVEHIAEHPGKLRARHDGKKPPEPHPGLRGQLDVLAKLGMVVDEPLHSAPEALELVHGLGLERLDREERDEADHRAHLQPARPAVGAEDVVVEAVALVPEVEGVHRVRDIDKVLEELRGDVLVGRVLLGQLERDREHVEAVHRHPRGAVGLLDLAAPRQWRRAIEEPDVVEAEEAALEDVLALGVLAVDPPGEVQQQLVEDPLEEHAVAPAADAALDPVDTQRGPRVNGWVDVPKRPLVRRHLAVRVHVPFAQEQHELGLGEVGVDERERDHVEREVPRRVPRVLPGVRHRDHVVVVEVEPLVVPPSPPLGRRRRLRGVTLEPAFDVVVGELLRPEEPRERLPHDALRVVGVVRRDHRRVELVRLGPALGENGLELRSERIPRDRRVREPEARARARAGAEREPVVRRRLRTDPPRVDRIRSPLDDVAADAVLDVRARVRASPEALGVRVVLGEEELGRAGAVEPPGAERRVIALDRHVADSRAPRPERRALGLGHVPRPGVPVPERRKQMELGRLGAAVRRGDPHEDVVGRRLRVLHRHVEVAVAVEDAGVEELVLRRPPAPPPILLDQGRVWELGLRVLVQELHVGMRRR